MVFSIGGQSFANELMGTSSPMPRVHARILVAIVILLSAVILATRFADAQRNATDTYAITNARIITISGPVIDRGTVVIRDGLIAAVGANVSAPADARVIDGTGLTVYPGLIDANTSLGIPEPSPAPSPAAGGATGGLPATLRQLGSTASGPNSTQPPGLQPEVLAEDLIRPGGAEIDSARNAGITTALTAPRPGIWMGQSALINLAGETPQQMIVRSPVAMHVGFIPLRGGYPSSLMGVFATLRQMLLDAERYREARQIYERSPRGTRRPAQDRSLEALIPVLEGRMLVVFYVDREREIQRALDLADEFKLRAIIAGGADSWKVTEHLQKDNVPVLLSLNFPKRTTAAMPEADPEPLRVLRERVEAPKTAAKLAAAKVRFAFQSGALGSLSDFVANAAKTVENGLDKEDALRALTIRAAEIFGVADRLGSVETGKIANLTVTRGALFDRNSRVAHVFIDGRPVDLRPAQTALGQTRSMAGGTWTLNVNLGQGEVAVTLELQQEGERLRGSIQGPLGSGEIANASVAQSGEIHFTVPVTVAGQTAEATFSATISGNEMKGTVNIAGRSPGSFTGARSATPGAPSVGAMPPEANSDLSQSIAVPAQQDRAAEGGRLQAETLIRNATILTITQGTLRNSDVLIRRGKIAVIGKNLKASSTARVIDATGKYLMPGIIDCHSHSMLDAINEGSLAVTSMARTRDVLNPTDPDLYRELAGGATTLNLLHGSANPIGGLNTVVKIKYGRPIEEFIFPGAMPGIKFALGENPKRSNTPGLPGLQRRYPATRMGVEEVIRDAFTRARDYQKTWDEYRAALARGEKNLIPPRRDLQLEPLVEVLEGKRYVHAHCYRADEILMLINIANEFGFKVRTFQHVLEGYKIAKEIAQHGAGASIFADFWGYKIEAYDAIPYNAAIMTRAGVVVSMNSDSDERARRLNIEAAKAMRYGDLTEAQALRLITINPAIQLGIQDRVGSIEVGKDADLAVWNGHPFSVYARVDTTFIDGDIFFDRQQDLARRAELQQERAQLEQAEPNRPPASGVSPPAPPRRRPADADDDMWEGDVVQP